MTDIAADGSWVRRLKKLANWKLYADAVKHRPAMLRVADKLGRGKGRGRLLDRLTKVPPAPLVPDLRNWEHHALAAAWVGHSTVLLRVGGGGGATVLTDPVFSRRVGIGLGLLTAGPARFYQPAVKLADLPALDLILLSHAHFDHLDRPTLSRLARRDRDVPVVTAADTADLVDGLGFRSVTELPWGEAWERGPLKVTAVEVNHWGARTFYDTYRGYNGYLIESSFSGVPKGRASSAPRVFYAGDTADHRGFEAIAPVDLALMPIAAYDPWVASHATPEQAWRMANEAGARVVMPIHHSTFRLSREPMDEPIRRFLAAAEGQAGRVALTQIGGTWSDDGD